MPVFGSKDLIRHFLFSGLFSKPRVTSPLTAPVTIPGMAHRSKPAPPAQVPAFEVDAEALELCALRVRAALCAARFGLDFNGELESPFVSQGEREMWIGLVSELIELMEKCANARTIN